MPRNRIQLNGFGQLGRIQEQALAAGLDSLNVRPLPPPFRHDEQRRVVQDPLAAIPLLSV